MIDKATPPLPRKGTSATESMDQLVTEVGTEDVGEAEHLGDFIEGTPAGDSVLWNPIIPVAQMEQEDDGALPRKKHSA